MTKKEREWAQFINLARKIAWNMAEEHRRPADEMLDAAEYALALTLWDHPLKQKDKWDPERARMSTFVYSRVYFYLLAVALTGTYPTARGRLRVSVKERWLRETPVSDLESVEEGSGVGTNWLGNLLAELSEEARALVGIVLDAPSDVMEDIQSHLIDELDWTRDRIEEATNGNNLLQKIPAVARRRLKEYLIDELDWTVEEVNRTWFEVKGCL